MNGRDTRRALACGWRCTNCRQLVTALAPLGLPFTIQVHLSRCLAVPLLILRPVRA